MRRGNQQAGNHQVDRPPLNPGGRGHADAFRPQFRDNKDHGGMRQDIRPAHNTRPQPPPRAVAKTAAAAAAGDRRARDVREAEEER